MIVGRSRNAAGAYRPFRWCDPSTPVCAADIAAAGGIPGTDGVLDNNDFIVFIDYFFAGNALADRGAAGGTAGSDGAFDNNDFIVFIDQFFEGCGG